MKKIMMGLFCLMLFLFPIQTAYAGNGNEWVLDEPDVLTDETEQYIKSLNEEVFLNYNGKPQLGIMVINSLPEGISMDDYKLQTFNTYGVGTKEENHGMLFIFSISDRKYGFEIGDGFKQGSMLRKALETDFVNENIISMLRAEDYDGATKEVVSYLAEVMENEEKGIYAEREKELKDGMRRTMKTVSMTLFSLSGTLIIFSVLRLAISYFIASKKRKMIEKSLEKNKKYATLVHFSKDEFVSNLFEELKREKSADIDNAVRKKLYHIYLHQQGNLLDSYKLKTNKEKYLYHMGRENTFEKFLSQSTKSIGAIVKEVDEMVEGEERIRKQNEENISQFILSKKGDVENCHVSMDEIRQHLYSQCVSMKIMPLDEIEKRFYEELRLLSFRKEYNSFLDEHSKEIDFSYFRNENFFHELLNSDCYGNYDWKRKCNFDAMQIMLLAHMQENQRREENKIRQEKKRQEEMRKREEMRREEEIRNSMDNSSFGSGFDGGCSSGGGFSGGW